MTQIHERESKRCWKRKMHLVAYGCSAFFLLGMGGGASRRGNIGHTVVFGEAREVSASCQGQMSPREEV